MRTMNEEPSAEDRDYGLMTTDKAQPLVSYDRFGFAVSLTHLRGRTSRWAMVSRRMSGRSSSFFRFVTFPLLMVLPSRAADAPTQRSVLPKRRVKAREARNPVERSQAAMARGFPINPQR